MLYEVLNACRDDDVFKKHKENCDSIYVEAFAYWLADDIKEIRKQ